MYQTTQRAWLESLRQTLNPNDLITDPDRLASFSGDETRDLHHFPEAAAFPRSVAQVSAVLRVCSEHRIPIVPRGGGSGVSGGAAAIHGGLVLSLRHLNRIVALDARNMTVTVEAGMVTGTLQDRLAEKGLRLPPDPGSRDWCQIGGNLAEAAAGPKSVKYGAFRDYVLNLEVVLADGRVIWTGADVRKFACGYNLTHLMLGSEGTLGVITKAVFRLVPAAPESVLLRMGFTTLEAATDMICGVFTSGLTPSEVEIVDRDAIALAQPLCDAPADPDLAAYLWIGFDGREADILMADAERAADLAESIGCADLLFASDPDQVRRLWTYRHRIGPAVIETTPFRDVDLSFPRAALADVVHMVKEVGRRYGFRTAIFGHAGDGNLHVNVLRDALDEAAWQGPVREGIADIYRRVCAMGGTLSGEHGVGCTLTPYLEEALGSTRLALMAGIKKVFDPQGILNPGKIVETPI